MRKTAAALALCLLLCGCGGQPGEPDAPAPVLRSDNGRPVVQVGENLYLWRYTADSVEPEGLWGNYAPLPAAENALVRLSAGGTWETVYTGPGCGDLWYLDGYLFASSPPEAEWKTDRLTCLTLDGETLWTLDNADVLAADMERGFLLCQDDWGYGTLFLLTADGERTDLWKGARFLAYADGAVYVQDGTDAHEAALCRVDLTGGAAELARVSGGGEYGDRPVVVQVEAVDGTVYFLWGAYGGTAQIFYGGELCEVRGDGTGARVLAETWGDRDRFFLRQEAGRTTLLVGFGGWDGVGELDPATGAAAETSLPMAVLREPFRDDDGAVRWVPDRTGRPETLTAPIAFPEAADFQNVRAMAVTEDWVWYTLETGTWSEAASIGWRDGYARQHTWVCRQMRGGGEQEVLYEY